MMGNGGISPTRSTGSRDRVLSDYPGNELSIMHCLCGILKDGEWCRGIKFRVARHTKHHGAEVDVEAMNGRDRRGG